MASLSLPEQVWPANVPFSNQSARIMGLALSDHPELFETGTSGLSWDTVYSRILTRSPSSEYKSTKRLPQRWISHLNSSGVHKSPSRKKSQVAGFTKTSWSQEPATTYSLVAPGKCDFILTCYNFLWFEISFLKHLKDMYFVFFCDFLFFWLHSCGCGCLMLTHFSGSA